MPCLSVVIRRAPAGGSRVAHRPGPRSRSAARGDTADTNGHPVPSENRFYEWTTRYGEEPAESLVEADCIVALLNWPALENQLRDQKWKDLEFLRYAYRSLAAEKYSRDDYNRRR